MNSSYPFAELSAVSNFSFLHGASHAEEIVEAAATLGYRAIAICDHQTVSGIVRAFSAAKDLPVTFLTGARLLFRPFPAFPGAIPVLAHPYSRKGYGNLCRIISAVKQIPEHESRTVSPDLLASLSADISFTVIPPEFSLNEPETYRHAFAEKLGVLTDCITEKRLTSLLVSRRFHDQERSRLEYIHLAAKHFRLPLLASNDALYHSPERRQLQDVLHCIRIKRTVEQAGFELQQNSERHLKGRQEIYRLFRDMPEAIERALAIADICSAFSLTQLTYEYPNEVSPQNETPAEFLRRLVLEGAEARYPQGIPDKIIQTLNAELLLIGELEYEKYFLTCYDIVRYARSKGILCQGRGAAASSAVCYCLGITSVNPVEIDLLFARFISKERNEPPDIDIDFEHERREEVIQYIYNRYGRERAALVCEVVSYRPRSAVRDVGKALGLSLDVIDKLAKSIHRWNGNTVTSQDIAGLGLNPADTTIRNTMHLSTTVQSFPRHLSQHVGGFIISDPPLCEMVPILNASMKDRTVIEWDKDDIETLRMLKIDILGLGMLSCIRRALDMVNRSRREDSRPPLAMHQILAEKPDPAVYAMICEADTIGVFQIESRAQMSMLPRLRPEKFYDLVVEVAIVRPGPIQGNMVHPYLRRRHGQEVITYPDDEVREILEKTLGVPLFQEQAMKLAITLAGFTPGEAEKLRRAMAAWKHNKQLIASFSSRIINGMTAKGYSREYAETCVQQIKGFSEYGFPESHAASFALLVYVSAWLKRYYPAEFTAALLNSQPMGFYAPSQIIRDAEMPVHRGRKPVSVLPIDINRSQWESSIEDQDGRKAVRLGFHQIRGIAEEQAKKLVRAREGINAFTSISELWQTCISRQLPVSRKTLEQVARADAFYSCGEIDRHQALWQIHGLTDSPLLLQICAPEIQADLPVLDTQESMFRDYEETGFSLRAHPLQFLRPQLERRGVSTAQQLKGLSSSARRRHVQIAGIAIVRQRPPTAKGMLFLTLEDETGITNAMVRPAVYEQFRQIIVSCSTLLIKGTFERVSSVIYIHATAIESLDALLKETAPQVFSNKNYSY